jgi:preprotein translocase subunit SecD
MKAILYFLIVILVFGSVATGFIFKENSTSIVIQSVDNNIPSGTLTLSAKTISDRLNSFSAEKYTVAVVPGKNQIRVLLKGIWDIPTVERLLIQKGELSFYESCNREELADFLKGDNFLFSSLNRNDADLTGSGIGCISVAEVGNINEYLSSSGLNQQCKFAWSHSSANDAACLYALRWSEDKSALLTGKDIDRINTTEDAATGGKAIEIRFKPSVVDKWADATKRNFNRTIVIVLDDEVLYSPVIKSEITNGVCSISGSFTPSEANFIVSVAGNGELQTNFNIVK